MFADPIAVALGGVEWSFHRNRYKDVPSFTKGVTAFHTQARGEPPAWQPDAIVIAETTIRIKLGAQLVPSMYGGGAELHDRADDRIVTLRSAKGFTAAALLFEAHNALRAGLEDSPDAFLHEIVLVKRAELFEPSLYEVRTKYWVGAAAEQPHGELPRELLRSLRWSFRSCGTIKDEPAFVAKVRAYAQRLRELASDRPDADEAEAEDGSLRPDEIVVPAPIVFVHYMIGHRDRIVVLRAARPEGFTEGQLLHAIHNEIAPHTARTDHVFFEGLTHVSLPLMPPGYSLELGS